MDKIQRLDEIACVTDLKLIRYFNPHKGYSIKQDRHSGSNGTEDEGYYFWEESESEKTNNRDTLTTCEHKPIARDDSLDYYCAMSLAVHYESKIGSDNNPSFATEIKNGYDTKVGMTPSWKNCCTIF